MTHQIAIEKNYSVAKNTLFSNNNTFTLHNLQHFADMLRAVLKLKLLKEGCFKKNLLIMVDLNNRTSSVGLG